MEKDRVVIENEDLRVEIALLGAELKRIYSKKYDIEYLWEGKTAGYWERSATLLFPFVGRLQDGKYKYKDKEYSISCHGFARDSLFSPIDIKEDRVVFLLKSNAETKALYPFDFSITVTYALDKMNLSERVEVVNLSSSEMPFKLGFHPGFNVPFDKNTSFEDYRIEFRNAIGIKRRKLSSRYLDLGEDIIPEEIDNKTLRLNHLMFKDDALVLSNTGGEALLLSDCSEHSIRLCYDTAWCGIWQTYKNDTPFVAIEPWYNLPGEDSVILDLSKGNDLQRLLPNEVSLFALDFHFR